MATKNDYPSYLPDDFKGLDSILEGNQRYYFERKDGQNFLRGAIVGNRHLVIRFPEGSTIVVPPDSVGTEQIKDGAVEMQDLHEDVKNTVSNALQLDTVLVNPEDQQEYTVQGILLSVMALMGKTVVADLTPSEEQTNQPKNS